MTNDDFAPPDTLEIQRWTFEATVPWAKRLLERLSSDELELTHVRRVSDYLWHLRARLPVPIQEGFGTAPEVLIVVVRGQVLARDLERALTELYRAGFRLDLDLLIVCDDSPDLEARIERLPGRWGQVIPWPPSDQGFPSLHDQFERFLPKFDLFEEKSPVRGRQVIGRQDDIADLSTRIEAGDAVGVFGLRKVGKTSVVRAATDALDPVSARLSLLRNHDQAYSGDDSRAMVIWFDVQRAFDRTQKRLFDGLAEAIETRLRASKIAIRPSTTASPLGRIDGLLKSSLNSLEVPICLVLDEYDYLFEGSGGQPPIPGVGELFRLLRGWAQETRRLSTVVIGRDPAFAQRPEITGFPNPLLGWMVVRWLGPIKPEKAPELLRKLGKRVGLDVGAKTASLAADWTGGHPLLHRQFGSVLLQISRGEASAGGRIATDPICERAPQIFEERDTVREVCAEVLYLLRTRYFASYKLLEDVALAEVGLERSIEANGGWSSPSSLTLRNFGILQERPNGPFIPRVLLRYLKAFEPRRTAPTPEEKGARVLAGASSPPGSNANPSGSSRISLPPLSKFLTQEQASRTQPPRGDQKNTGKRSRRHRRRNR